MNDNLIEDADEFTPTRTADVPNKRSKAHNDAMQQHIMKCLATSGQAGATNREIVAYLKTNFDPDAYDSPTSGATSRMHRDGIIVRLAKKRGDRVVYVHPDHVPANAVVVQPKKKEEAVLGFKSKNEASREEVEALNAEIERLKRLNDEGGQALRDEQQRRTADINRLLEQNAAVRRERDSAQDAVTALQGDLQTLRDEHAVVESDLAAARADVQRATERAETAERTVTSLHARVGALQTSLDQAEVQTPTAQGPRKTFTHDERRVFDGLAKLLREKYRSDGTADAPARITLKVSTVRTAVNAAFRVVSD